MVLSVTDFTFLPWGQGVLRRGHRARALRAIIAQHDLGLPRADDPGREAFLAAARPGPSPAAPRPRHNAAGTYDRGRVQPALARSFRPERAASPPEVGILGIGHAAQVPRPGEQGIVWRSMLPLSLTIDHRAVDGVPAAAFLATVVAYLERPARLVAGG